MRRLILLAGMLMLCGISASVQISILGSPSQCAKTGSGDFYISQDAGSSFDYCHVPPYVPTGIRIFPYGRFLDSQRNGHNASAANNIDQLGNYNSYCASDLISGIEVSQSARQINNQVASCTPPSYAACLDRSTGIKPYSGALDSPPSRNSSFTDPVFNRKIWRITDTTTTPAAHRAGAALSTQSPTLTFSKVWNLNDTALIVGAGYGAGLFMRCDLSNPNAPSCHLWRCTSGSLCDSSILTGGLTFSVPQWANTENYAVYGINALDVALYKATLNYNSSKTPVTSFQRVYSPYDSGQCLAGQKRGSGANYTAISIDDQYSWGYAAPPGTNYAIVLHKNGHGCIYIDLGVAGWSISGDSSIAHLGPLSWYDDNGNPSSGPGNGCHVHGITYDSVSDTVLIDSANSAGCFAQESGTIANSPPSTTTTIYINGISAVTNTYNGGGIDCGGGSWAHILTYTHGSPSVVTTEWLPLPHAPAGGSTCTLGPDPSPTKLVHLSDGHASHISHPWGNGLGGHGLGFARVGSVVGDLGQDNYGYSWNPTTIAVPAPRYTTVIPHFSEDGHGSNSDYISGRSSLPIVGVLGMTKWPENSTPPLSSYSITQPYSQEILIPVVNSITDSAHTTVYRAVHTYNVRDPNGAQYASQVLPNISHNRLWVAFGSNWFGHLGKQNHNPPVTCNTNWSDCRTDVFLVYLGDAGI